MRIGKIVRHELIALEKALTPATALSTAPGDEKNTKPIAWLVTQLETKITDTRSGKPKWQLSKRGNFNDALVLCELLQYFEEFDAAWKGQLEPYKQHLSTDPIFTALTQLPSKIMSEDDGANILASNVEEMGPIAFRVRLTILGALTAYYMSHQRPDMIVKFARQALPSLMLGDNDRPSSFDVAIVCELAYALMLEKDLKAAVEAVTSCVANAKKVGDPVLLQAAHQTNAWVLEAAGKHDEAQESVRFLLTQKPDEPVIYVQLAQIKTQQGDGPAAADAWRRAIQLYEGRRNLTGAADAHFALATLQIAGAIADPEKRSHLEAADALYRQIGSIEGRVKAEESLGIYYADAKE